MTDAPAAPIPPFRNSYTAPFIYFDYAPAHGVMGGAIEVELTARTLVPDFTGGPATAEIVPTARLRCSPFAASALMEALRQALEMFNQLQQQATGETPPSGQATSKLH